MPAGSMMIGGMEPFFEALFGVLFLVVPAASVMMDTNRLAS